MVVFVDAGDNVVEVEVVEDIFDGQRYSFSSVSLRSKRLIDPDSEIGFKVFGARLSRPTGVPSTIRRIEQFSLCGGLFGLVKKARNSS